MNDIISLLDLEDSRVIIEDISIEGNVKTITLTTSPEVRFCPRCNCRMHSKGIRARKISHPILQDTYQLVIILKQRRWRCTNTLCRLEENEEFNFIRKRRRSTSATDFLIVNEFRDLNMTAADIARKFRTTDTHVLGIFDHFVHMKRLPLSDVISIDEVYLNIDPNCKYVLVIQDFRTGEPIDLLKSRRKSETEPYFAAIPKEERFAVRYLISDMNNDYLSYVGKYFPNAVSVVDSFHVIQWINMELDKFVRAMQKNIAERDVKQREELSKKAGRQVRTPMSDELYLLKNYRFFLLSNADSIKYHDEPHMDRHFRYLMKTSDYEELFFRVDPALKELRYLKERYVRFNAINAGRPQKAASELDQLIDFYAHCAQDIFIRFSKLLKRHREPIINSFILIERLDSEGNSIVSRLSNGPIEGMNRKAKDLKRQGRGYRNFDHLRNRFLFATRTDPELNGREFVRQDGPHALRYRSTVLKSRQRTLNTELESILEKYDCTDDELLALRHWVSEGNSPFENPDGIYNDSGLPCDFIAASRILDEAFYEDDSNGGDFK
jgi:transposase